MVKNLRSFGTFSSALSGILWGLFAGSVADPGRRLNRQGQTRESACPLFPPHPPEGVPLSLILLKSRQT